MEKTQGRVQNLTASQRLENLEYVAEQFLGANQTLVNGYSQLRSELQALKEMFVCSMELAEEGMIGSMDNIQKRLVDKSVKKLEESVKTSIEKGELVQCEEVQELSFVVCQEYNESKELVNPRIQFSLSNVQDEKLKADMLGKKIGESIQVLDSSNTLQLLEIYLQPQK